MASPTAGPPPPNDGSIAVIIVNYNGRDTIAWCLRSLQEQTYAHQVVVVDNQSSDGSADLVQQSFPAVRLIEQEYNAGWGVACNTGIEATESEYVALLNNDAYLDKDCLAELVRAITLDPQYGSCASRILLWDEPDKIEVAGLVIHRDGTSVGRGRLRPATAFPNVEDVFCANDCCCLYRRTMLQDIGLYDPDFFIYCDETDMGWRHQLAGWRCVYAPRAIAYHAHSRAAGSYSDFKAYHVERNRIWICMKYFPWPQLLASFFYAAYRYLYQVRLTASGRGSLARYRQQSSMLHGLGVLIRAHVDAFKKAPVMLRRRRSYRAIRRLSDKDVAVLWQRYGVPARDVAAYE